jgi:hypothetical protein
MRCWVPAPSSRQIRILRCPQPAAPAEGMVVRTMSGFVIRTPMRPRVWRARLWVGAAVPAEPAARAENRPLAAKEERLEWAELAVKAELQEQQV